MNHSPPVRDEAVKRADLDHKAAPAAVDAGTLNQWQLIRRRFARRDAPHCPPVVAELPVLLERSKAGPGLLASILTAKYCDHLPLYRQQQIARLRHGIDLSRQDMSRWVGLAAEWLRPIYLRIRGDAGGGGCLQADETEETGSVCNCLTNFPASLASAGGPDSAAGPWRRIRRGWS